MSLNSSHLSLRDANFQLGFREMKRAYLFDIGNVILRFDFSRAAAAISKDCGIEEEQILPRVQPFTNALETGILSIDQFIKQAGEMIEYEGEPEQFMRAFEDIFTLNEPIVDLIESLASNGHSLYLLSNTNAIHVPYFTAKYSVFSFFSGAIYSHEVGSMKPDEPMYSAAISRYGLEPDNTIYIDDLPANIETGKRLGFCSFQYDFRDHAALEAWLGLATK